MSRGNNYETSTATAYTTTLSQAESLTVSVQSIAPLTYTASQAAVSPKISINGLKLTDTATATSATFNYAQGTTNLSFSTTRPTNSDTYTVRASGLTLTSGTLSKYKGVIYVDTTLRINRAQQANLYLAQYAANFGTPYRLVVIGGSGTGNITETVTAGTASGCTLNIDTITTTTQGSCLVTAIKAQDQNYETATVTAYVYLLVWAQAPTATVGSGSSITLNSETSITRDANVAPTISGLSTTSASVGSTITLTGAGFYFADSSKLVIKFWRNVIADRLTYSNYSDTSVTVAIPAGATTGRIVVVTPNGVATSVSTLAIS
jgi:hypothetical protein